MPVDDFGNEVAKEVKIYWEKCVEGKTPVSMSVEGVTPNLYVEGGTPFESLVGATPELLA